MEKKLSFWVRNSVNKENNFKSIVISVMSYRDWDKLIFNNNIEQKMLHGIYNFKKLNDFSKNLDKYNSNKDWSKFSNFMTHPSLDNETGEFRLNEYAVLNGK